MTVKTPECDKMLAVRPQSETLSSFVDWLEANGYAICTLEKTGGYPKEQWVPHRESYEEIFGNYFGIDIKVMEREKLAILNEFREAQK
jgi:hypothetical protein